MLTLSNFVQDQIDEITATMQEYVAAEIDNKLDPALDGYDRVTTDGSTRKVGV